MGKIVAFDHVTLDGVMQAPARPDEDRRGGFGHGGWAAARMDEATGAASAEGFSSTGGLLFGRKTYEDFFKVWPKRTDGNPFTAVLNQALKYVVSTTLTEPLPWENSVLVNRDVASEVATIKKKMDKDLVILGSGKLVQSLMQHNLVDEFVLLIHPLVLSSGRRLFADSGRCTPLRLREARTLTNGIVFTTYELAR